MPDVDDDAQSEVVESVRIGDLLAGKYRIERVLGEGGMGVVAAAWHTELEQRVAIKFLLAEALESKETLARFKREARAAVKIRSEHVARVIDVGHLETGAPYMVMEYMEGSNMAERLAERGPLPVKQAVEFILHACDAVAEAHGYGIIHRDLKPSNLFVITRPDGTESVKVLDFGISKTKGGPDKGMTQTHQMMGSPYYMSPEQMRSSRDVDSRADVWALAATLYELVTGVTPFQGESLPELIIQVTQELHTPLRELVPDFPEGLEAIIDRCLQKDRENRYASVAEMALELAEFGPARGHAVAERILRTQKAAGISSVDIELPPDSEYPPPLTGRASRSSAAARTQATWQTTRRTTGAGKKERKIPTVALAAIGVVGLAGVGVIAWLSSTSSSDAAAAASSAEAAASAVAASPAVAKETQPAPQVTPAASAQPKADDSAEAAAKAAPVASPAQPRPPTGASRRPATGPAAGKPPAKPAAAKPPAKPAPPAGEGDVFGHRK